VFLSYLVTVNPIPTPCAEIPITGHIHHALLPARAML
jgi:hypothetical protein